MEHVTSIIHLDDRHIIIHTDSHSPDIEWLRRICREIFPKLIRPTDWIWEEKPSTDTGSQQKSIPTWFNRAIEKADKENNWKTAPFVALEARGGLIHLTPLSGK